MKLSKNDDLVSVIVPVFNVSIYLEEGLTSLVNQTYQNLEIILVNDGSTDNSHEIATKFAAKDSRIKIFDKENGGSASARNYGLERANGEYLMFMDPDDVLSITLIENLHASIKGETQIYAMCKFSEKSSDLSHELTHKLEKVTGDYLHRIKGATRPNFDIFYPWGKLFSRDIFFNDEWQIRFPLIDLHDDQVVALQTIHRAKQVVLVDTVGYYYRVNNESLTKQKITPRDESLFLYNEYELLFIRDNEPQAFDWVVRLILSEGDYVAMKCVLDGSELAADMFGKVFESNRFYAKTFHVRENFYRSKTLYRFALRLIGRAYGHTTFRKFLRLFKT
ncbi:MAG: glycosyltransferase [Streptococcaceae bacterium]|jgi:glycosyltransferase involved in cell wall biosynthesis|nr:glycosyltransferase [Streptococcaceae bacterium]